MGKKHIVFLVLSIFSCLGAVAQDTPIYRWKDANGQTNYGVEPPPGVEAALIGGRGTVSVIPPPSSLTPEALAIRRDQEQQRKINQLQSEVEKERRRRSSLEDRIETRRICEEEYGVACDDNGDPLSQPIYRNIARPPGWYLGWGNPPYVRPPYIKPHPPIGRPPPGARPPYRPPQNARPSQRPPVIAPVLPHKYGRPAPTVGSIGISVQ